MGAMLYHGGNTGKRRNKGGKAGVRLLGLGRGTAFEIFSRQSAIPQTTLER